MKRLQILILLLVLCPSAVGQDEVTETTGPSDPAELESFFDGAVEALMTSHQVPGATVSVVKDGEVFFAKGYGYADVDKRIRVDPEKTMFRIASVSKLFAWTGLMQLVEKGEVDLDEDVNAYIDFEIPATFPEPITPKHLLTHSAGFEDRYRGLFGDGIEDLGPLGEILAANIPARVFPPGQESAYSNYGAALAGYIIERVSGIPFQQYVEEKIYSPLEMNYSTFRQPVPSALEAYSANGYTYRNGAFEAQGFEYDPAIADGAMSTSAVDMAHFMIAHLQNGQYGERRILQEETAKKMHSRIFAHDPRIPGMAHGFYEVDFNGQRGIAHGGDLMYFHSDLLLLEEHDLGLFVSFNSDSSSEARNHIVNLFLDRYFPAVEEAPPAPPADFASRASRYTGSYRMNRYAYETLEKTALLGFGDVKIRPTDAGGLLIAALGMESQIVEVEPLLFRVVGGDLSLGADLVAFREDASGRVVQVFPTATMTLRKVPWYDTVDFHRALLVFCLLIFLAVLVKAFRRRKIIRSQPPRVRWRYGLAAGLSFVNLVFVAGFSLMLVQAMETALIPDSVFYLLFLPVVALLLTIGFFVLLAWEWKTGTMRERILGTCFGVIALAFLWFLDYWNLLGWHF